MLSETSSAGVLQPSPKLCYLNKWEVSASPDVLPQSKSRGEHDAILKPDNPQALPQRRKEGCTFSVR